MFKFLAFKMDAEKAHERSLKILSRFPLACSEMFDQSEISKKFNLDVAGMKWTFPVGLAAGLDKNAEVVPFFSRLLFGALEVGTVTPRPQIGNPRPRLFRLTQEESLLNRMGFNNLGAQQVFENISRLGEERIKCLGVNLGKNKDTPQDRAIDDYKELYKTFAPVSDYLVINISSPNTPGLRDLQSTSFLDELFKELKPLREKFSRPLFLKLAPDLHFDELVEVLEKVKEYKLAGVIATNTTIMKDLGEGGISGKLLSTRAREFRHKVLEVMRETPNHEVIGVGGISSYQDLREFWAHGGNVVQLYSAFIYQGPSVLEKMKKGIEAEMAQKGASDLRELIELVRDNSASSHTQ